MSENLTEKIDSCKFIDKCSWANQFSLCYKTYRKKCELYKYFKDYERRNKNEK